MPISIRISAKLIEGLIKKKNTASVTIVPDDIVDIPMSISLHKV